MSPLDVVCPVCWAKVGQECDGLNPSLCERRSELARVVAWLRERADSYSFAEGPALRRIANELREAADDLAAGRPAT